MDEQKSSRWGKITLNPIGDNVYFLDLSYTTNCYLVVGTEKALLIDCGTGFCDVKGAVKSVTDLPVTLVLTHGHTDHLGGMVQFDKAYIHKLDWGKMGKFMATDFARGFFFLMDANARKAGITWHDFIKGEKPQMILIEDGFTFDLGGKTVTVKHTPGHSRGSIALVDEEDKIVFSGDNVCDALWMMLPGATSIEEWLPSAKWLYEISKTHAVYWAHRESRLTTEYIGTVIKWGEELVSRTKKNALFSVITHYPKQPDGIIYRTGNILKKRK